MSWASNTTATDTRSTPAVAGPPKRASPKATSSWPKRGSRVKASSKKSSSAGLPAAAILRNSPSLRLPLTCVADNRLSCVARGREMLLVTGSPR
eukprot:2646082-Prymnesium_polylepis.1